MRSSGGTIVPFPGDSAAGAGSSTSSKSCFQAEPRDADSLNLKEILFFFFTTERF